MNTWRGAGWLVVAVLGATSLGCRMVVAGPIYPVGPPRSVVVVGPPRLVLIEDIGVSYCPDIDDDIFFYDGYWYGYRSSGWFYAREYSGPWVVVKVGALPAPFIRVPPGRFKHRYNEYHPAHEHHPDLDRWNGEVYEDKPGRGEGNGKGRGHGRGRGNGGWKD